MDTSWALLATTVEAEPQSGKIRKIVAQIVDYAYAAFTRGPREEVQETARRAERFARKFGVEPDAEPALLQYWYAGQMHMLATMCRAQLADQVSQDLLRFVRTRAHAQNILTTLKRRELGMTTLASELNLDVSQVGKMVDKLEELDLIETHKTGTTRWVRLTSLGERTAAVDARPAGELDDEMSAASIDAFHSSLARVVEQMEKIAKTKGAIDRLTAPAERFHTALQQLAVAVDAPTPSAARSEEPKAAETDV